MTESCALAEAPLFLREIVAHVEVASECERVLDPVVANVGACVADAVKNGGKLLPFGDGGSAADVQQIGSEFLTAFQGRRPGVAAIVLTADSATLTAIANDADFEWVPAKQIRALEQPGDVVLGFSTSGMSRDVVRAFEAARERDRKTVGWTGRGPHQLTPVCDLLVEVPSHATARVQETHLLLGHVLCLAVQRLIAPHDVG